MLSSSFDVTAVRFSMLTLGVVAAATACGLLGTSILQSPHPHAAACMAASGLKSFGVPMLYGGVGLLALWAHVETRHSHWEWHGWREMGRPVFTMRAIRGCLASAVGVAIVLCFVGLGDAIIGTSRAAQKVANGACPLPVTSTAKG